MEGCDIRTAQLEVKFDGLKRDGRGAAQGSGPQPRSWRADRTWVTWFVPPSVLDTRPCKVWMLNSLTTENR
jgi:hypothetical protein